MALAGLNPYSSTPVVFDKERDEQVKATGKSVILLLDEPGLSLHGKAQGDLLRYFEEKLAPHHQVIYTTHSPFMVVPDRLASCRIVEDKVDTRGQRRIPIGTKVREDILTTDPDTLFPLQGALGYEITQSLFIGKHTLLVEGASDILYLQTLSHALKMRNRAGRDARWTVCPTGGIGNVSAFEAGRVFTISDFTLKPESDIEDLFESGLFASIVNAAYNLPGSHMLTAQKLEDADKNTVRLVKRAEAAFNLMPEPIPTFDHFTPSAWLVENLNMLDGATAEVVATLSRAEKLFSALNAVLA